MRVRAAIATSLLVSALMTGREASGEATPVARVVIDKSKRTLRLEDAHQKALAAFPIALGSSPTGTKHVRGDGATPEGSYFVTHVNRRSRFHLSLGVSYPNVSDADDGVSRNVITKAERDAIATAIANKTKPPQDTALGGDIFLHGGGTDSDWTQGCVALADEDIDRIEKRVPVGTPILVRP